MCSCLRCWLESLYMWIPSEFHPIDASSRGRALHHGESCKGLMLQTITQSLRVPASVRLLFSRVPLQLSLLQLAAIKPVTAVQYLDHITMFGRWALSEGLELTHRGFWARLYIGTLCDEKETSGSGSKVLAAALHESSWPHFGASIRLAFPGTTRAHQGWARLVPPRTRQPLPLLAVLRIVALLIADNLIDIALAILIGFSSYLRP